jgi:pyruvate/2-oxoglutarate dehydrogenase complex dihydrolipoamide dehydrogenase (E3) component
MECDVAVLGGGSGGYPAAIRATQLGASVVCVEQEASSAAPACGSAASRPRPGCRPLLRSRRRTRPSRSSASRSAAGARLRRRTAVEGGRRQAADRRRRDALQGERDRVGQGRRPLQGREHALRRGREDITFKSAIVATGSSPLRPPIEGIDSERCVDSTGLSPDRGAAPDRHPRRRHHRLRVRLRARRGSAAR